MRLVPGVEDAVEHALGRRVVLRARADEALAELQQVHDVVQAAALAADAGVGHEQVLLDNDRGVAVDHPPQVAHHLEVAEVAVADGLHDLARPRHDDDQVRALGLGLDHDAADFLPGAPHALLYLPPELGLELLRRRGRRAGARVREEELEVGLGRARCALDALAAKAQGLLLGLEGHEAHARPLHVAHELQQRRGRVVEDQHLVAVGVLLLADDLAVAEAGHLPVRVDRAVLEVALRVLLGQRVGAGRAPQSGRILAVDELVVLALDHALDAALHLLDDRRALVAGRERGPGPLPGQQRPALLRLLLEGPAVLLPASVAHGLRPQAGPEVLVQRPRLVDALALCLGLGPRAVDHDHLPVQAGRRLPEVQRELLLRGRVGPTLQLDSLPVLVSHREGLLILVLGLQPKLFQASFDFLVHLLLPGGTEGN
mmetsp:Transcript_43240/g.123235  ORF Transcript_43240/g.123235 Transcript_43240/m.123235 type:complete len:429 (+) Transcript_43240:2302-3588(+)